MKAHVQIFATLLLTLASPFAFAYKPGTGIDRFELEQSIEAQSGVDHATAVRIVDGLADQFKTQPGQRIPIRGYLFTHGLNFGLLRDTDTWLMNAWIQDDDGKLVKAKNLYEVLFQNGGIKYELAYKFMFTFIPSGMSVKQLDGAVFGRGLGATINYGAGLELAWMPGANREGSLIQAAIKFGIDTGVQFPKMTFHLRRVQ